MKNKDMKTNEIIKASYVKPQIIAFGKMKGITKGNTCGTHDGQSGSGKSSCI